MKRFNINSDQWDGTRDREGWRIKAALVGRSIGGELIGATMSEVEPGSKLWLYHTHYLNEEWVMVLRGEPMLRTPRRRGRPEGRRCRLLSARQAGCASDHQPNERARPRAHALVDDPG
jgi:hypothetical protein